MARHKGLIRALHILAAIGLAVGMQGFDMIRPLQASAQASAFLVTPYYGSASINSYFDHDSRNNYILVYDGRTANIWNGVCGYFGELPVAYYTQPGSQGDCLWYDGHQATDFGLDYAPVLAAAWGSVAFAGWNDQGDRTVGYGLHVRLLHLNNYQTRYGHMSAIAVIAGTAQTGQIIGTSGNTGNSTGPHLHFEVRDGSGNVTDPFGGSGSVLLWKHGQWADHPLPAPPEVGSTTVDDGDSGFTKGCAGSPSCPNWFYDNQNGYNGDHWYTWASVQPDYWARWGPVVSTANQGVYLVRVRTPYQGSRHNSTVWQGQHTVQDGYGTSTAFVDHRGLNDAPGDDHWADLGAHLFLTDYTNYTQLTNQVESFDAGRYIGADAARFVRLAPTYLPDVRARDGWLSTIVIRSNGGDALLRINYLDAFGAVVCYELDDGFPVAGGTVTLNPAGCLEANSIRSAVVYASQDISVVVLNDNGTKAYAYSGIPWNPAASGIGVGTSIYVPSYFSGYYGWNSDLTIQNAGSATTTIDAYLYNDSGTLKGHWSQDNVAPGWTVTIGLSGTSIGSVRVTASTQLAVIVRHGREDIMAYEGFSSGGNAQNLPTLFKSYYGWTSSYQTQEVAGISASVVVTYYPSGGRTIPLNAWGHKEVYMGGEGVPSRVSAQEWAGNNGRVTSAVHHASSTAAIGYHGAKAGARNLFLPVLKKGVNGWDASLTVQNVGATANASVTVRFYDSWGTATGSYGPFSLSPGYSRELYSELPNGVTRSVWVHSEGSDVIAAVHDTQAGGRAWGYSVP